jgi:hypothetical protein
MLWYSIAPSVAGSLVAFIALWVAHARGCTAPASADGISACTPGWLRWGLGVVALLFGSASIDYWTIMRFFGSRGGHAAPRRLKGPGFFARPAVLPVRPTFLFGSTRVCVCAGDYLRP